MNAPIRRIVVTRAALGVAALLALTGCAGADDHNNPQHARFQTGRSSVALPRIVAARARLDGRTLTVEATIETGCKNDEAALTGGGGFGVTGRTYLVEASVKSQVVCMTEIDRQDVDYETELDPTQQIDDVMIRLERELTQVPIQRAQ